jgi:hypothetical protein
LRSGLAPLPARERAAEAWRLLAVAAETVPKFGRGGGRPAGRPERRLEGAAQLAARFAERGLLDYFVAFMEDAASGGFDSKASPALVSALTVPGLIGRSRAVEMAGNAVLPCLAALGPEAHTRLAEALYRRLPLPARYGAVRHLHQAVGTALSVDFRRQQGMLYLLRQYCTQGGCGRCPLS